MIKFGLSEKVMNRLFGFFTAIPEIDEVIIYGSRARGNFHSGSDIDLTLKGKSLDFDMLRKIRTRLDSLNLPYFIDLSLYKHINNPELVKQIDLVGKTFYIDQNLVEDWQ